jgi:hypothetical protein
MQIGRRLSNTPHRAARLLFSPCVPADTVQWLAFAAASAGASYLAVLMNAPVAFRATVTLLFLFFVPGLAIVRFLRLTDPLLLVTLAVGTSLALDALVSITMLYAGVWSPRIALAIIAGIGVFAALIEAVAARVGRIVSVGPEPSTAKHSRPCGLRHE